MQEEAVESGRTRTTGSISLSPMGKSAAQGSAEVTGSAEPHCRTNASDRTRSEEVPASTALDDASRGGCTDGISLRADNRKGRTLSVWQTIGVLFGIVGLEESSGKRRRLGHDQARQFSAALLVSGRKFPDSRGAQ